MVPYDRQTVNSPNPLQKFAHRQRMAKSILLASKCVPKDGTIVDFGAGNGLFLSTLGIGRPDVKLFAVEPFMAPIFDSRINYIESFRDLSTNPDLISAFEVCEHLTDQELEQFFSDVHNSISPDGRMLVSVPIMIGGALIVKELSRSILFRRFSDYSASELIAGLTGRVVPRPSSRIATHKGFDFRWLRHELTRLFIIEEEILSPFLLPWWANSQIFFVCTKRT
jgi:hypothetical protein